MGQYLVTGMQATYTYYGQRSELEDASMGIFIGVPIVNTL